MGAEMLTSLATFEPQTDDLWSTGLELFEQWHQWASNEVASLIAAL